MINNMIYKRKRLSGCCFNLVKALVINRDKELLEHRMGDEIDKIVYESFSEDLNFCGFLYFYHYIENFKGHKIKVGKVEKDIDGEKFVVVKVYIDGNLIKVANNLDTYIFVALNEVLLLEAIIKACQKYKIPEENYKPIVERRSKLGNIPEWIPEMETNPQLVIDLYKASVPK